jgi:glycosyltransferase involved in cell wall biosynthesis
MITYNHASFIAEAIEGIVNQVSDEPFELVIGEDFSTDNTRAICEKYQQRYPHIIRLLPSENNLGVMPNLIRTLKACKGDKIAFCEGDDYWTLNSKIQDQSNLLNDSDHSISAHAFNVSFYDERSRESKSFGQCEEIDFSIDDVLFSWPYHISSLMIRSELFNLSELTFLSSVYSGDKFMNLILATKGVIKYNGLVQSGVYRRHADGLSASTDFMNKMNLDLLSFQNYMKLNSKMNGKIHRAMFTRCQSGLADMFSVGQKLTFGQKMRIIRLLMFHFVKADKKHFKGLVYFSLKVIRN